MFIFNIFSQPPFHCI